jgi:glycosyltransferase involved in cell wall biosynthesis
MVVPQPFFRARGTPFSVLHRVRALLEAGHQVDMITYPFGEDIEMSGLKIVRCAPVPGIRDVRIGPSIAKLWLDFSLYLGTLKMLREGTYDIIHSHEEAAFFCGRLARKNGLRHVYDMHSSLPQQLSNFKAFNFYLIRKPFEFLEDNVLSTCDGVITICRELSDIVESRVSEKPHELIENTGDDRQVFGLGADHRDVRSELSLGAAEVVLYTGTFEAYQGIDLLLESFAIVRRTRPNAHLILVGGQPSQVEKFRKLGEGLGLSEATTYTGTVHPSEVQAYISATDLIVSPRSRGTNTPLKIYGYLRSGKPLVATDRLTHTQTLTQEISSLVPATAEDFAAGIVDLLSNPDRASALASAAKSWANVHCSDELYLTRVKDFYEQVCGYQHEDSDSAIAQTS